MPSFRRYCILGALLACFIPAVAQAQVINGVELVRASLVTDAVAIQPGKPFTVGLRLQMEPNWHTYWQNSGDAGLPTKIAWQLPPGFSAGPIQWPLPEKISSPGDIENYGYADDVVLLTEITPPAQLPPGGSSTINAKADWLVCEKICVPGSKQLALTIPAAGGAAPAGNAELIAKYRALLPRRYSRSEAKFVVDRALEGNDLVWRLSGLSTDGVTVEFFPLPPDGVQVGHPVVALATDPKRHDRASVSLAITAGLADAANIDGVLVIGNANGKTGWMLDGSRLPALVASRTVAAVVGAPSVASGAAKAPVGQSPAQPWNPLWYFLPILFFGGLSLNVMPCVLPVISLKIFTFIKQADEDPKRIWRMGLAYAAGVFAWFMGFAVLVVALQSAGRHLGYAFQLQNPWFIVALIAITFVFSLSLLGVFEFILPGTVTNAAGEAAAHTGGYLGAFFQGILATVLGSACTVPYFGAALGFAFSQTGPVILVMFAAIAAGMSAPFLLLAGRPGWLRFLPKPGVWMERVKQATGFLMLATVLWLLDVLGSMRGHDAVIWAGGLLLALGAACWVQGAFNSFAASTSSRWLARLAILLLAVGGGGWCIQQIALSAPDEGAPPVKFGVQLAAALKTGRPVFVDFTASWCVNCKVNERLVLNTEPIQQALRQRDAIFLKADWSTGDEDVTKVLKQFNRAAVPLYVIYPARNPAAAIVLPELLTAGIVLDGLAAADKAAVAEAVAER